MKSLFYCLAFLPIILLTGCGAGAIYTHTTKPLDSRGIYEYTIRPLDINFRQTPISDSVSQGNIKHVHYYVDVMWDSNAIGDISKRSGFSTIYHADLETFKILGIWNQYKVHVYGK